MPIIERIQAKGGDVVRDKWRISLKRGRLKDADIAWLKKRWPDVCREAWESLDAWEERAAIMEFDAGRPRAEAEAAAYEDIAGLKC